MIILDERMLHIINNYQQQIRVIDIREILFHLSMPAEDFYRFLQYRVSVAFPLNSTSQ